jgi:putative sterol carrier protein
MRRGQLSSRRCAPLFFFLLLLSLASPPRSLNGTRQNNGIFEFRVKNTAGEEESWTIDLKKTGTVKRGEAKAHGFKPDVTIILSDETFVEIADGKTTGQKAFMTGKLKTKGNMMLATKLDGVLKVRLIHLT